MCVTCMPVSLLEAKNNQVWFVVILVTVTSQLADTLTIFTLYNTRIIGKGRQANLILNFLPLVGGEAAC